MSTLDSFCNITLEAQQNYYNYINDNISSCLNGNNGFGYEGNNLREFVFEYAGPESCVDVTLQTMLDEMGRNDPLGVYRGFVAWLTDVNGEALSDELLREILEIVVYHIGYHSYIAELLSEKVAMMQ